MFAKAKLLNIHLNCAITKVAGISVGEGIKYESVQHPCVKIADLNCAGAHGSQWGHDGGLLRSGVFPIVVLTSGRILLLAVAADLLQHAGDI